MRGDFAQIGEAGSLRCVAHVHDQRIEIRPPLGGIDPRDRFGAVGARCEAVDRLCRHRDKPAFAQNRRRARDSRVVRQKRFRSVFAAHDRALYLQARKAKRNHRP